MPPLSAISYAYLSLQSLEHALVSEHKILFSEHVANRFLILSTESQSEIKAVRHAGTPPGTYHRVGRLYT